MKEEPKAKPNLRTNSVRTSDLPSTKEPLTGKEAILNPEVHRKRSDRISVTRNILHKRDQSIDIEAESSESSSEATNVTDGDGGWDNISQHTLLSREVDQQLTSQKTSLVCSNIVSFNSSLSFYFDVCRFVI